MKRGRVALAISAWAFVATGPGFTQGVEGRLPVIEHPGPGEAFRIATVYPGFSGPADAFAPNACWSGPNTTTDNTRAVAGILCLARAPETTRLDVNAFATCPPDQHSALVQSFRFSKMTPGSMKCPNTYRRRTFWQFGSEIRTWWTLTYTQPGTRFILEVTVRCLTLGTNLPRVHMDRWTWEVGADLNTLENGIHLLHQGTLGTTEIPCVAGEDMLDALLGSVNLLRSTSGNRAAQQDALFSMEALVIAFTAFGEFVDPDTWFPNGPPSNLSPLTPRNIAGLIDTVENPCGCKILADLEYLGTALGILSL